MNATRAEIAFQRDFSFLVILVNCPNSSQKYFTLKQWKGSKEKGTSTFNNQKSDGKKLTQLQFYMKVYSEVR